MDFAFESGAIESVPSLSKLTSKGYPTSGNPSLGIPATRPGDAWFYAVTSEIVNAIKKLGKEPTRDNIEQLADALIDKFATKADTESPTFTGNIQIPEPIQDNNPVTKAWLIQYITDTIQHATEEKDGLVNLCQDIANNENDKTSAVTPFAVMSYIANGNTGKSLDIGEMGRQGFGVGFPDATEDELAAIGLTPMNGTYDKTSDNYGNFMSDLGGVFVFIPHFFVRYGSEKSSVYETYGVNSIDIKRHKEYATEAEANADGFFTPRGFYDGSSTQWKQGVFIQKYEPFAKAVGGVNYPYGDGSAYGWSNITPSNMMTYAKNLGSDYHVATAFAHEVAEIILIAQAQHSTGIANCAWWQSKGGANYPMQWNAATPEKYSHNGQKNGIMMISNCRWEFAPGITTAGTSATQGQTAVTNNDLYILKPEIKAKDITNGFGDVNDAWGTSTSLLNIYDKIDVTDHFTLTTSRTWYWGNGNTRMFMQPIGEDGILVPYKRDLFMLVPDSNNSVSSSTNTAMGPCLSYNNPTTQNLTLYIHGENVYAAGGQNVFSRAFSHWRTHSNAYDSFRCGVYLRD